MMRRTLAAAWMTLLASAAFAGDGALKPLTQEAFLALPGEGADAPFVLDVRSPEEFVSGYVPGAVNIPHDQLASRLTEVPKDKEIVLYCRSGRRAALAADVLAANGYSRLEHLEGDIAAWVEKGRPVEKPRDAAACIAALKGGRSTAPACTAD